MCRYGRDSSAISQGHDFRPSAAAVRTKLLSADTRPRVLSDGGRYIRQREWGERERGGEGGRIREEDGGGRKDG